MPKFFGMLVAVFTSFCWARQSVPAFEGFVTVDQGISLYAKVMPGEPNAPIFVPLNGLTQDSDHWKDSVPVLRSKGATVVTIDLALQGRSMSSRLSAVPPYGRPILPPPFFAWRRLGSGTDFSKDNH